MLSSVDLSTSSLSGYCLDQEFKKHFGGFLQRLYTDEPPLLFPAPTVTLK